MKINYVLTTLSLASLGLFAFQRTTMKLGVIEKFTQQHRFSAGGQSGLTGAPGESNCTACHSGSVLNGSNENSFQLLDGTTPVSTYTPGSTYTITLQQTSSPSKSGFSSTALDASDVKAGSLVGAGIGGTQNFSATGRDYVSHTSASSSSSAGQFAWSWIAPATNVGPVTFYIASNIANGNGSTSGDMIYLSTHIVNPLSTAGLKEVVSDSKFEAGYNASTNKLVLNFTHLGIGEMNLNLVDMNGRSVFSSNLGQSVLGENKEKIALPSDLKEGMYVVHFFIGNKAMSANILVKR